MPRPILSLRPQSANAKAALFWIVWRVGSKKVAVRHPTLESAEKEAGRLGSMHPISTFYVMESRTIFGALDKAIQAQP